MNVTRVDNFENEYELKKMNINGAKFLHMQPMAELLGTREVRSDVSR